MSGFYIGIDGKARKVKGAYVGVDGVARKIKKGYIGDENGVARLCWSDVGKKLSKYTVGSTVYLLENGNAVEYLVVHQGLPSSLYDASCNGTWLLRKDIYTKSAWSTSETNEYSTSNAHNHLNDDFFELFNTAIKNAIKAVKIPYVNGVGMSGSVVSGSNGLSTRIFFLSVHEVGFTTPPTNAIFPHDGDCLDFFNGVSDSIRVAKYDGSDTTWFLRSPYTNYDSSVWSVYTGGTCTGTYVTNQYGFRPAMIMNSNAAFDPITNIFMG